MNIGFIGNFEAPYSTENDRAWSFNKLGHNVTAYQENKVNTKDISTKGMDVLFYSHTHGWEIPGLKDFFLGCMLAGVPTASVHLDRWAGLAREKDIGIEATWFTEYLFMADMSPEAQKLYDKLDKKVYYTRPGVVEKGCYMAAPDPVRFPHEIVFVGSKNYHPEYPFRKDMINFLHNTYGDKFGHYGDDLPTLRGHDLNTLYATAKIVVGDTCFGGRPNYVSDRYYETRGRGGFLLHPKVSGVDVAGMGFYEKENLTSLREAIEYSLDDGDKRRDMQKLGFVWVKSNETYTHRAEEMLKCIKEQ